MRNGIPLRCLFVLIGVLVCTAPARSAENLLRNPDLDQGSGDQPSYWRTQRLLSSGGTFNWSHQTASPGELQIRNRAFDVAQWAESIALVPGWYRLSGEVQTLSPAPQTGAALLGVSINNSTSGWGLPRGQGVSPAHGEFYFRLETATTAQIVCRFTAAGTASFRHLVLTRIAAAPARDAPQADFGAVAAKRKAQQMQFHPHPFAKPTGALWTEIALMTMILALVIWGWHTLSSR